MDAATLRTIRVDLPRTFPMHSAFSDSLGVAPVATCFVPVETILAVASSGSTTIVHFCSPPSCSRSVSITTTYESAVTFLVLLSLSHLTKDPSPMTLLDIC